MVRVNHGKAPNNSLGIDMLQGGGGKREGGLEEGREDRRSEGNEGAIEAGRG